MHEDVLTAAVGWREGPPHWRPPPAPEGTLYSGYFNLDLRQHMGVPRVGGLVHLVAHHGAIRSDVVSVEVPTLDPEDALDKPAP